MPTPAQMIQLTTQVRSLYNPSGYQQGLVFETAQGIIMADAEGITIYDRKHVSGCGRFKPHEFIRLMIEQGVDVVGIAIKGHWPGEPSFTIPEVPVPAVSPVVIPPIGATT